MRVVGPSMYRAHEVEIEVDDKERYEAHCRTCNRPLSWGLSRAIVEIAANRHRRRNAGLNLDQLELAENE